MEKGKGKCKATVAPPDDHDHVDERRPDKTRDQDHTASDDGTANDPEEATSPLSEADDSIREMVILDNWKIDRVDEICQDETWLETVTRNVQFNSDTLKALEKLSEITKGHIDKVRGELSSIYRRRRKGSVNKIIDLVNEKGVGALKRSEGLEARPRKDAASSVRLRGRRRKSTARRGDQGGASGQTGGSDDNHQEDHEAGSDEDVHQSENALIGGLSQSRNIVSQNQKTRNTTTDPQASQTELGALMAPLSVQVPLDHASETEHAELVNLRSSIQKLTSEMDEAERNIEGLRTSRGGQNAYVKDGDPQVTTEQIGGMELGVLKKNQELLKLRGRFEEIRRGLRRDVEHE